MYILFVFGLFVFIVGYVNCVQDGGELYSVGDGTLSAADSVSCPTSIIGAAHVPGR